MSALPFALLRGGWMAPRVVARPPRDASPRCGWVFLIDDSGNAREVAADAAFVRAANLSPAQESATRRGQQQQQHHGQPGEPQPEHHRQA